MMQVKEGEIDDVGIEKEGTQGSVGTRSEVRSGCVDAFPSAGTHGNTNRPKAIVLCIVVSLIVMLATGLLLGLLLPGANEDDAPTATRPAQDDGLIDTTPVASPTFLNGTANASAIEMSFEEYAGTFLPSYSLELALANASSPQRRALAWLNRTSQNQTYEIYRLRQRYALAVFFYSTSGDDSPWYRRKGWLVHPNECQWSLPSGSPDWWIANTTDYQHCTSDHRYTTLYLPENNFIGTIPAELELLRDLKVLDVFFTELTQWAIPTQMYVISGTWTRC
jgi:hypothetical protein